MTIPNLITEHQKRRTVTELQRAISILNQAYKLSYEENGAPSSTEILDDGTEYVFEKYWAPYVKVLAYCSTYDVCGYTSKLPFTQTNGSTASYQLTTDANITFWTLDGFLYSSQVAGYGCSSGTCTCVTKNSKKICVDKNRTMVADLNGSKAPNRYGKDVFLLSTVESSFVEGNISVIPRCYDYTDDEIDEDCSSTGKGYCCAEKIRRAGWKIEKDYPW